MEYVRTLDNNNKIANITVNQRTYTGTTGNLSIRFVLSGNETYTIGKRQLSIHSDSFLILNKGTQFTSNIDPRFPANVFSVEFDSDFLSSFLASKTNNGKLSGAGFSAIQLNETMFPFNDNIRLNILLLKHHLENGNIDQKLINEHLQCCLLNCYQVYNQEIFEKAGKLKFLNDSTRMEILRRLNLAREYLYANYNKNINLDNLAGYACLSVNHLLRTFKMVYNQSPHQYLIQLRLHRAQALLAGTEYPVYEIVSMVGFKCTSSFVRLFKSRYQTTPLKYRQIAA